MAFSFSRFSVGDVCCFERSFSAADFDSFSRLSGDCNLLHHDDAYARASSFGRTIVPLHVTLAPLSMVAGMVFPGLPSLYLSHEVRAAKPVFYGDLLVYSARLTVVNTEQRTLGIQVLALRGTEVVLDAQMRVRATAETWDSAPALPIFESLAPRMAVITGASGEIGGAVALTLAARGWKLLLQDRGVAGTRDALVRELDRLGASYTFCAADLLCEQDRSNLCGQIAACKDLGALVHCASPGVGASLKDLVSVNYSALKELADAAVAPLLRLQKGMVLLVGSSAMLRAVPRMEDYSAAKTMAARVVQQVESHFSPFGVRGVTLMPGFVATRFSEELRQDAPSLSAQEVAEAVSDILRNPPVQASVLLEVGRRVEGSFGFRSEPEIKASVPGGSQGARPLTGDVLQEAARTGRDFALDVYQVVARVLRLSGRQDLRDGGLGVTPGWDSLRQIEIVLALESSLGVTFSSSELSGLGRYSDLEAICIRKLQERV